MPISFTFSVSGPAAFVSSSTPTPAALAGAAALRDKALDPLTNDLLFEAGDQVYTSGIAGIASDLKSHWLCVKGEWFLDLNLGVDYWGVIFAKEATDEAREEEFRREGMTTQGVSAITLELTKTTSRRLEVRAVVTTDTGLIFSVALSVAGS